ncbi:diguanylate cyclase [Pseudomaricurvus alkylphenolicus]|uniref:sensor domain-containing diguanylate cyclase n=1 Tax=Pseudomaricurvus alkylphenolicus TaxID=1306991 RepID=UPI00141F713E|nr:diguanylate cyclase [Pseudomaricurvus alkylphenolicus]NIB44165.1 diguanylate cyclase [Pseudomaricurvus alkylphenolicus]
MTKTFFLDDSWLLTDALTSEYRLGLVLLSYLTACLAAYAAWGLSDQYRQESGRSRHWVWLVGGGFAMGCGIWAMHFIGMLAYSLPMTVTYDLTITLLSMLPAVIASSLAIYINSRRTVSLRNMALASVFFGIGIGTMHYIGMAAMQLDATMLYDKVLFVLSIVAAVMLSYIALKMKFLTENTLSGRYYLRFKVTSILIMGAAITGMHYMGMAAVYFFPNSESQNLGPGIDPVLLSSLVMIATGLVLTLAIVVTRSNQEIRRANESLYFSRERLRQAIDTISDGFVLYDAEDRLVMANQVFRDMYPEMSEMIRPGLEYETFVKTLASHLKDKDSDQINYFRQRLDWHRHPNDTFHEQLHDGRQVFGRERRADTGDVVGVWTDISVLKQTERKLEESRSQMQALLRATPTPIVVRALSDRKVLYLNNTARKYAEQQNIDLRPGQIKTALDTEALSQLEQTLFENGEIMNQEVSLYTLDNQIRTLVYSAAMITYDYQRSILYSFVDITERKELEEKLRELAHTDSLTGLHNRRFFTDQSKRAIALALRNHDPLTMMMLDIDHFKRINDNFGHDAGDKAIQAMADICRDCVRQVDIIGRMGGEEFGIVFPGKPLEELEPVAERLRQRTEGHQLIIDGNPIEFTISLGLAQLRLEGDSLEEVMKRADVALYKAKEAGRNRVINAEN